MPVGTAVRAAGCGTVTIVGVQEGLGMVVLVHHRSGSRTSLYAHLEAVAPTIRAGASVCGGPVLGWSGRPASGVAGLVYAEAVGRSEQPWGRGGGVDPGELAG